MAMTALERKALFKASVTLNETTMAKAAEIFGVSYNHLSMVLKGDRIGSVRLEKEIAQFAGKTAEEFFGYRDRGKQKENKE